MKKVVLAMLVVAYGAGCANMSDKTRTTAEGAGVGAVVGGILGAVIGHQTGKQKEGAIIGAVLGGAIGGKYGNHVAGKKAKYAKREDYLNACLAQAQKVTNEALAYNGRLKQQINNLDAQVNATMAAYQQRKASKKQVLALKKNLQGQLAEANKQVDELTTEITIQNDVIAKEGKKGDTPQLAKMRDQVNSLKGQRQQLLSQTQRLAAISNRMSV